MHDPTSPLLELRFVCKSYGTGDAAVEVLRGVDLALESGGSMAVLGPSGCGKSTLLNCIGTLERPTFGEVRLEGVDWQLMSPREIARMRSRRIGFVFQLHHLLPQCTALENVLLPTLADPSLGGREAKKRAAHLLERVGLGARMRHRPGQLSGGERQRVAVARALINRPALLLADEPTGSLDAAAAESLGELLMELNREEGVTLLVATHSMNLACRMVRTGRLEGGRLLFA